MVIFGLFWEQVLIKPQKIRIRLFVCHAESKNNNQNIKNRLLNRFSRGTTLERAISLNYSTKCCFPIQTSQTLIITIHIREWRTDLIWMRVRWAMCRSGRRPIRRQCPTTLRTATRPTHVRSHRLASTTSPKPTTSARRLDRARMDRWSCAIWTNQVELAHRSD